MSPRADDAEGVLDRAVGILAAFDSRTSSLTLTELSRRTGLALSTASRLVSDLMRLGLLERSLTGRIQVGVRLWELGSRAAPTKGLREAALPAMEDLHTVIRHHVQLGVRSGHEVLFLERLSSPDAVINLTEVAGRLSLHTSSSGLVLLAHAPPEVQRAVLAGPLPAVTAATLTDPARLRRVLAEIRRVGFVRTPGHIHPDATGVAVPIRQEGAVIAALGVVVPNDDKAIRVVPALRAAALWVQRSLQRTP